MKFAFSFDNEHSYSCTKEGCENSNVRFRVHTSTFWHGEAGCPAHLIDVIKQDAQQEKVSLDELIFPFEFNNTKRWLCTYWFTESSSECQEKAAFKVSFDGFESGQWLGAAACENHLIGVIEQVYCDEHFTS